MKFLKVFMVLAFLALHYGQGLAAELGPIDIHGFISQGYLKSTANDYLAKTEKGSYEFNEMGVNFSCDVSNKLRLGLQLFSRDMGDAGNNEVGLDWGYADYRFCNEVGLRLGKIRVPYGLYNEGRDLDMLRTTVFLPQGIYLEYMRSFYNAVEGGGVYGNISAGLLGSIEYYSVLGSTNLDPNADVLSRKSRQLFLLAADDIANAEETVKYNNTNRLIWNTPLEGLRLGWTYANTYDELSTAHDITMENPYAPGTLLTISLPYAVNLKVRMHVLSGEYKWQNLTLAGEYTKWGVSARYESPAGFPEIPTQYIPVIGYYGLAAYRFADWLEVGGYYSVFIDNAKDRDGEDNAALRGVPRYAAWQNDACLALRFDINPYWLIKLEGHHINGTGQIFDYASVDDLRQNWSLYAVKTTVSF